MMYPAGTLSTYAIFPQLPHSSSMEETQASFSSPGSPASCVWVLLTGSSSQKTHLRHLFGKSARLSRVMLARRRGTCTPVVESADLLSQHGTVRRPPPNLCQLRAGPP